MTTERRQHARYTVPGRTIAITPRNLGQLIDISLDGCSIKYIGEEIHLDAEDYIDILMKISKGTGCYMQKLPINVVWEETPDFSAFSTIIVKKVGMSFKGLTSEQKQQIKSFIEIYGTPEV
jgi:hypothetical protein